MRLNQQSSALPKLEPVMADAGPRLARSILNTIPFHLLGTFDPVGLVESVQPVGRHAHTLLSPQYQGFRVFLFTWVTLYRAASPFTGYRNMAVY